MNNGRKRAKPEESSSGVDEDVSRVRLLWVDSAGLRRARLVPYSRIKKVAKHGVGLTHCCMSIQAWGDVPTQSPGEAAVGGDVQLVPDMSTLRRLPWYEDHAIALTDMMRNPQFSEALDDGHWVCCPRNALRRAVQQAREQHGVAFRVGFETEFVLLEEPISDSDIDNLASVATDNSLYCQSSALNAAAEVLDKIANAVEQLGIEVEQVHGESAGGQFEVVTGHEVAMTAVDNLLLTREAIACVAEGDYKMACFLPKLAPKECGSGAHCHISLQNVEPMGTLKAGSNLVASMPPTGRAEGGPGALAASFAAGILAHLPALVVWTLPSAASYDRLQPGTWSGCFRVWGVDNREAPVRLCASGGPNSQNWEFKALDATANPYLALAAILLAGCDGIEHGWKLPEPCSVDPQHVPGSERLPKSLAEAIHAFEHPPEGSPDLRAVLVKHIGAPLVDTYMSVRRGEEEHFRGADAKKVIRELYNRY